MEAALAIDAREVGFSFGAQFSIDGLQLQIRRGEVFGYLGHNGAGKTTTIRLLNGLLAPRAGAIEVLGRSPQREGEKVRAASGVLTETPSLDERLTGRENLAFHAELQSLEPARARTRVQQLLDDFELSDRADERVGRYSKGMRQRLALARALLHEPQVLFLDEPTSGLDPVSAHQVHQLIAAQRAQGRTVFLCTHNLTEAQQLCDRIAVLERGRIIAQGSPAELARGAKGAPRLQIEVHPDDVARALELVRGHVAGVEVEGAVLSGHARREAVPALVAALAAAGVRLFRVNPEEPTLEEFYLALHGREGAP